MNRNQRRSKVGLVVLSSGLVAALALPSASAALTDGRFFVHAQNTQEPSIEAYAGIGGLQDASPGDGDGGGDGDTSPSALEVSAGPLSLKFTEAMLAFSEANRKAQEEGRTEDIKTASDGWQTVWYIDPSDQSIHHGLPSKDGSIIFLSKESVTPTIDDLFSFANDGTGPGIAFYAESKSQDTIQAVDRRGTPKDGASYIYMKIGSQAKSEGRYMMSEGKLIGVYVIDQPSMFQIQRQPAKPGERYSSERFPDLVSYDGSGNLSNISVRYPDKSRGYSRLHISNRPDQGEGGLVLQFDDRVPGTGPKVIVLNGDQIVRFEYENADGTPGTLTASSAAEYNAATGQNWDGKLPRFSDFDTSIPFRI